MISLIHATAGWRNRSGIYAIVHIQTGKSYIGSASCLKTRICSHRSSLRHHRHCNSYLQHAWNSYGERSFSFVVLEECPKETLIEREGAWMQRLRSSERSHGYNLDCIVHRTVHSEETKQKIRESHIGRTLTLETRLKIGAANRGNKHPPRTMAQRENHRKASIGRVFSQETRAKMSAIHKGKVISEKHKAQIRAFWEQRRHNKGKQCLGF